MNNNFSEKEIMAIVERYMNDTCSREEFEQLLELARSNETLLADALKIQWEKTATENPDEKPHFDRLFTTIMKGARTVERVRGGKRRLMTRITVAASLLLCLSTAGWWLWQEHEKSKTTAQTPALIVPGGDKAILTLADGRQIALDTAHNGDITNQGATKVIKLDGKLHYNSDVANNAEAALYNTIATPKGGQYQLVLADGSNVWLNASSSLKFPTAFTGNERNVELQGEGYFEIKHNPAQPFHVKTGKTTVTVLGTHFNINSYREEAVEKTTLIEGRVEVNTAGRRATLVPGQQAIVKAGQDPISLVPQVDLEEVLAWKNGLFLYNGTDLETVMNQVARWYDVTIVYERKINETISGSLPRSGNFRQLLKILEATGKVRFEINGRVITVKPN
ncbi:FecR domain-containing protein [Niabella sp. CC-SYL272]|uniref:FecR family protein n=1 Tax=Niabella agricola TaxID=2891571 RepID=UPI001F22E822|nr:FecR domain-containing protein [Niabella agricola]MCF3109363.1 FecR domain-containing protein [Niabella agricola]